MEICFSFTLLLFYQPSHSVPLISFVSFCFCFVLFRFLCMFCSTIYSAFLLMYVVLCCVVLCCVVLCCVVLCCVVLCCVVLCCVVLCCVVLCCVVLCCVLIFFKSFLNLFHGYFHTRMPIKVAYVRTN